MFIVLAAFRQLGTLLENLKQAEVMKVDTDEGLLKLWNTDFVVLKELQSPHLSAQLKHMSRQC